MKVRAHLYCSENGKITGRFLNRNLYPDLQNDYARIRQEIPHQALFYGSRTMQETVGTRPYSAAAAGKTEDWIGEAARSAKQFIVVFDPLAQTDLSSDRMSRSGFADAAVVVVLSENASETAVTDLRKKGISFLFADVEDLHTVLDRLETLFGIHDALLAGGGSLDASFARQGLLDELSLVMADCLEDESETDVFAGCADPLSAGMKLTDSKDLPNGKVLRYVRS